MDHAWLWAIDGKLEKRGQTDSGRSDKKKLKAELTKAKKPQRLKKFSSINQRQQTGGKHVYQFRYQSGKRQWIGNNHNTQEFMCTHTQIHDMTQSQFKAWILGLWNSIPEKSKDLTLWVRHSTNYDTKWNSSLSVEIISDLESLWCRRRLICHLENFHNRLEWKHTVVAYQKR